MKLYFSGFFLILELIISSKPVKFVQLISYCQTAHLIDNNVRSMLFFTFLQASNALVFIQNVDEMHPAACKRFYCSRVSILNDRQKYFPCLSCGFMIFCLFFIAMNLDISVKI